MVTLKKIWHDKHVRMCLQEFCLLFSDKQNMPPNRPFRQLTRTKLTDSPPLPTPGYKYGGHQMCIFLGTMEVMSGCWLGRGTLRRGAGGNSEVAPKGGALVSRFGPFFSFFDAHSS